MTVFLLVLMNLVAAHASLAAFQLWSQQVLDVTFAPLALNFERNLATSTIGILGIVATVYSAIVLQLRRNRIDDYRGRYRIWYFIAASAFAASLGVLTGAGSGLLELSGAARDYLALPASNWWGIMLAGLVAAALIRTLVEIKSSRSAVAVLLLSTGFFGLTAAIEASLIRIPTQTLTDAASVLSAMMASCLFTFSIAIFGRHIVLDAMGQISAVESKPKAEAKARRWPRLRISLPKLPRRAKKPVAKEPAVKPAKVAAAKEPQPQTDSLADRVKRRRKRDKSDALEAETPQAKPASKSKTRKAKPTVELPAEPPEADEDDFGSAKLSRAERKRLRKEKRRQKAA